MRRSPRPRLRRLRGEEVLAQLSIGAALREAVQHHDDGSDDGMYDLRVGPADAPAAAIEVIGAVDAAHTRTWSAGPGRGPLATYGVANWLMFLADGTVSERVRRLAPRLLRDLEGAGWHRLPSVDLLQRDNFAVEADALRAMGCVALYCYETEGEGLLRLAQRGVVGSVDHRGESVPGWIADFLRAPERADVLAKLARAPAVERHVFVPVSFKGAPISVFTYLDTDQNALPDTAPDLPLPIDQVWIACTFGAKTGVRWDGRRWSRFDLVTELPAR